MNELLREYTKRATRVERKLNALKLEQGDNPGLTHTYHGGWSAGYWSGKLSTLEDIIDELTDLVKVQEDKKNKHALSEAVELNEMEVQYLRGLVFSDQLANDYQGLGEKVLIDRKTTMWNFTQEILKKLDKYES